MYFLTVLYDVFAHKKKLPNICLTKFCTLKYAVEKLNNLNLQHGLASQHKTILDTWKKKQF